jgi:heme/copper-type cytochrome/quinol oxidase subunit 2
MKEQILDFLMKYPLAWIAILLLVPLAVKYHIRKFKRATRHANDAKSKSLLFVGLIAAAIILWAVLQYT